MITRNNIAEVAYNIQSTVDAKHNISIDFKVTNQNDSKAMGTMVRGAKTILGTKEFTGLYDKGYLDLTFDIEHFDYNKTLDQYTCPAGQILTTNKRWYNKANGKTMNRVKHYNAKACLTCPLFEKCTKNKKGRLIKRSEHMDLIDVNKKRLHENMQLYRRRQTIVEQPFGVIKRQWDFYYMITKKTIQDASADVGMIFTAYNLRRIFNIIDINSFKEYLRALRLLFFILKYLFKVILRLYKQFDFLTYHGKKSKYISK